MSADDVREAITRAHHEEWALAAVDRLQHELHGYHAWPPSSWLATPPRPRT